MTIGAAVFALIAAVLIAALPRRFAITPLLLAATYTTRLPLVAIGPANLSVMRVVILVGILRVLARGERVAVGFNAIDRMLIAWATFLVGVSVFHTSDAWTLRLGMLVGEIGAYFLFRIFVQDASDIRYVFKMTCATLLPLAVLMLLEKFQAHNYFGVMGGFTDINIRDGHVRAYGPFAHPILAGTVGATCVPMALSLWRTHRALAILGVCSAAGVVFASTSSGPIMMVAFTMLGWLMWSVADRLRMIRWAALAAIVALQLVMNDPVYFLMARIDITGGSTGWHRAQLIRSATNHLSEWWAVGTDYTRHWMPTGVHANEIHTDITNHLLGMGVMGGLPLMILFVMVLYAGFRAVGTALSESGKSPEERFLTWTLGAMLFGQVMNFWSISLFDQSVSYFYLVLAAIGAVQPALAVAETQRVRQSEVLGTQGAVATTLGIGDRRAPAGRAGSAWAIERWSSRALATRVARQARDQV